MNGLCITFHEINGYIKDFDRRKSLTQISANEKDKILLTKFKEMFEKFKYLIQLFKIINT